MENNKQKRKKSIGLYFFEMLILFLVFFIIQQFGTMILYNSFIYLKYGRDIIMEAIWAALVLILLLLFKNSYIFTQEKVGFWESFKYGWPELVMSLVFLIVSGFSLVESTSISIPTILNLAVYCFFIGVVEEFLCRGWLFNEFLERYSDSKKGIILSIILSSLIFGLIHFFNIGETQGVAETILQVLNATVGGVFLTLVYYKTKNIWNVVVLHAIWDFTLMVGESQKLVECYAGGTATTSIYVYSLIQSIILVIAYLFIDYWLYKRTDVAEDEKPLGKWARILLPIIGIVIYLSGLLFINSPDSDNYYICPTFDSSSFSEEYKLNLYNYSEFVLTNEGQELEEEEDSYHFTLSLNGKNNALVLKNDVSEEKITLTSNQVTNYLLIDNKDSFIIFVQTGTNRVLYTNVLKESIQNDTNFLTYVKESLTEYVTPEISFIGSATKLEGDYEYAVLETVTSDHFFFDEANQLLLIKQEE